MHVVDLKQIDALADKAIHIAFFSLGKIVLLYFVVRSIPLRLSYYKC